MHRTRIKICGITRREDALAAADLGADAIGLICYSQAPRFIKPDVARQIVETLPPFVTPVGVFVDSSVEDMIRIASEVGLMNVQLNGNEDPELLSNLNPLRAMKAIRVDPIEFGDELSEWRDANPGNLTGIVVEPAHTGQAGGSGVENDWTTVRQHIDKGSFGPLRLVAAGGLTPETVAGVIRRLRPWAVDVSSGVEESKGIKSPMKIKAFIDAVREADRTR